MTMISSLPNPATSTAARALRPHQVPARDDVVAALETHDRALLVSACGTGKTVTLQSIVAAREDDLVVAFFPSLALVDQTIRSWREWFDGQWEQPIVVCSDETVGGGRDDELAVSDEDLASAGASVTRDPVELAGALERHAAKGRSGRPLVVFSTYQSSQKVALAQGLCGVWFDIAVFDEAHQVRPNSAFGSVVLNSSALLARKRVSATATPRVFNLRRGRNGDDERAHELNLLDDESVYGALAHEYGLRDAIRDGVLVDYRIHIVEVGEGETRAALGEDARAKAKIDPKIDPKDDETRMALGLVALERAQKELGVTRVVAYLRNRKRAHRFAELAARAGIAQATVITGDMPMSDRGPLLESLADDGGVIANVRCLTEGVDVPRLDAVLFVDPRSAKVDIVQAVGRAIRRHDASGKTLGHVILPVLESPAGVDVDKWYSTDGFRPLWDVLAQMAKNDTALTAQLTRIVGGGSGPKPGGGSGPKPGGSGDENDNKEPTTGGSGDENDDDDDTQTDDENNDDDTGDDIIGVWPSTHGAPLGLSTLAYALSSTIALHTVRLSEDDWDFKRYADEVGAFHAETGRWPKTETTDEVEAKLGRWLNRQRQHAKNGKAWFAPERRAYLDRVAPGWEGVDPEKEWRGKADEAGASHEQAGRWPNGRVADEAEAELGRWLSRQRSGAKHNEKWFTSGRRAYLDRVAPGWEGVDSEQVFRGKADEVGSFHERAGRWPSTTAADKAEAELGRWLSRQRSGAKHNEKWFTSGRRAYLDRVAPGWEGRGRGREQIWRNYADEVGSFHERAGQWPNGRVADETEAELGRWLSNQRSGAKHNEKWFTPERRAYLDRVAPGWEGVDTEQEWRGKAGEVGAFHAQTGRWPSTTAADKAEARLGRWLNQQRQHAKNNKARFTPERRAYLDRVAPGWEGVDPEKEWRGKADEVGAFHAQIGRWPSKKATDKTEAKLGRWLHKRRSEAKNNEARFTPERRAYLDRVAPGWEGGRRRDAQ